MTRFLIAAAVAALAVPAIAQVAQPTPAPMKMRNGPMADGVMTLTEVQSMVAQAFQRKDVNHDGVLTQDELATKGDWGGHRARDPQGTRPKMDIGNMFARMDTNKDGVISRSEFDQAHAQHMGHGDMAMKDHAGMRGMRAMHGRMMGGHMLAMADANKDGRITLAEAQAAAAQHFAMMDTNRDGRVTPDEMKAMREKMGAMHPKG